MASCWKYVRLEGVKQRGLVEGCNIHYISVPCREVTKEPRMWWTTFARMLVWLDARPGKAPPRSSFAFATDFAASIWKPFTAFFPAQGEKNRCRLGT